VGLLGISRTRDEHQNVVQLGNWFACCGVYGREVWKPELTSTLRNNSVQLTVTRSCIWYICQWKWYFYQGSAPYSTWADPEISNRSWNLIVICMKVQSTVNCRTFYLLLWKPRMEFQLFLNERSFLLSKHNCELWRIFFLKSKAKEKW